MPHMDGPTLLSAVREQHPEMIRFVLSGAAGLEANLRVIPVAPPSLKNPFDLQHLRESVVRSCNRRDRVPDEPLKRSVGKLETLPVRPGMTKEPTAALADPMTSMHRAGQIRSSNKMRGCPPRSCRGSIRPSSAPATPLPMCSRPLDLQYWWRTHGDRTGTQIPRQILHEQIVPPMGHAATVFLDTCATKAERRVVFTNHVARGTRAGAAVLVGPRGRPAVDP